MSDVRNPQQFFHGSDYEFKPGEEVVSGAELGRWNFLQEDPERQASVFMNPRRSKARTWGKHVFEVEPIGEVKMDEYPVDVGDVRAPKAKVIRRA